VALVIGGSEGLGQLEDTARDVLASGLMTPVVACGRNHRLQRRLAQLPWAVALGWRSDLPAVMAAADCIIQNAGGISSLEALATGTPTLTYRPIPGHGLANARALDEAGLVPYLDQPSRLHLALREVRAGGRRPRLPDDAPDCLATLFRLLLDGASAPPHLAA
jgi:UDP-N-acetylglucosamine:LPS N-acetylglucosamine transferase